MSFVLTPGTIPHRVIEHLKTLTAGGAMSTVELEEAIGQPRGTLIPAMTIARLRGLVLTDRGTGGRAPMHWFLPKGDPVPIGGVDVDDELLPVQQRTVVAWPGLAQLQTDVASPPGAAPKSRPGPAAKEPKSAGELRIALWCDGTLQLRRGGQDVLTLSKGETRQLVAYLERLAVAE